MATTKDVKEAKDRMTDHIMKHSEAESWRIQHWYAMDDLRKEKKKVSTLAAIVGFMGGIILQHLIKYFIL